jgi:predicted acetyltransferase
MKVEVLPAEEADRPIVRNLLQLYLHDFSEYDGNLVAADGRYEYPYLSRYWEDRDRHPFLIRAEGELGGFALIKKGSELAGDKQAMDVAEFFVLRGHRRKGIGREAFQQILDMFPGPWVVRVQDGIPGALAFWDRVISKAADGRIARAEIADGDRDWIVFRFTAP